MKSKANIKAHPLHPIMVNFPIALFTFTLLFDIITAFNFELSFSKTAYYLNISGIVTALLAAIPGIIDFKYTVPPNSSAKKRAAKHGIINVGVVLLFTLSLYLRHRETGLFINIGIEVAAMILLVVAAWMGGTLVTRNHIGIEIRYANKGRWKEIYINTSSRSIAIAKEDELEMNHMKLLHINGKRIVLAKSDSGYAAFDDHCTHRGGSLAAGTLICDTVHCPWHGSLFNIQSGLATAGPAEENIRTYKTEVKNGEVFIEL